MLEQDKWLNAVRFQDEAVSLRFRTLTTAVDLSKWDNAGQRIAGMSAARRLTLNRARRSLRVLWSGVDIPMDEAIRLFRIVYLADGPFAHYHLGGTNDLGFNFAASTLLTNAGAKWAREHGCRFLHLGGGNFNSDSLFDFKRSFGRDVYRYHTLDIIADESRYRSLVERRMKYGPPPRARQDFFPQYRA